MCPDVRARTFLNLFFTYHSTCPLVILPPFAHTIFASNERSQFMSPASFSRHPSPSSFLLDRNSTEKSACRAFLNYRFAQLSSISELNGNKEEGEGDRRFIALISTPSNRTAIDREDNFREYPRTEKKKEEDEGERRKEKFERTSIERSVFDVDEICFSPGSIELSVKGSVFVDVP